MLIVDDSAKELLDKNNIQYGTYLSPDDMYLTSLLNIALDTAIKYNDANPEDPEVVKKYVAFVKNTDSVQRCINKMDKMYHDILNIICNATDGKHEEIMNSKDKEEDK